MKVPALELRGVTKSYADRVALDDISLDLARGELVALVGANGAGKSTLLQLAVGLLDPTAGDVLVEGTAAGSLDARRSTVVHLRPTVLYDDLTVERAHRVRRPACTASPRDPTPPTSCSTCST